MIMPPWPLRVPLDAYNGNIGRHSGAADATATRPGCGGPFGARLALTATTAAAARARSMGGEATPGLERRQRAGLRGGPPTFFERLDGDGPCAHNSQQGQRPHREGEMPIPGRLAPHFRLSQAHFALGRLKAALDGPAAPRHPHHLLQGRRVRGTHHLGGQLHGGTETPPDQSPTALK